MAIANTGQECDRAAQLAAQEFGVPFKVMAAISRVETGYTIRGEYQPWPWTINVAGQGARFATQQELLRAINSTAAAGKTNFDVGCFQINAHWHGKAFGSAEDMIDPVNNARYAAHLLAEHFAQTLDWTTAAGRFHSKTPELAATYIAKFETVLANLDTNIAPEAKQPKTKQNSYPLLINGGTNNARRGSLVPITSDRPATRMFGG